MSQQADRGERAVRVFVSSTFRDMFLDREVLVKQVFPEISTFCRERGVEFTGIDLRTGVTAEQSESGMTLNLCLREVERCRPYFLCLLGERYGWCQPPQAQAQVQVQAQAQAQAQGEVEVGKDTTPSYACDTLLKKTFDNTIAQYPEFQWISNYSTSSVTELEIRHGFLNNPVDHKHTLFLFRNPDYVNELLHEGLVTTEEMPSFLPENKHCKDKLDSLKLEIRATGVPVVDYNHHADIRRIVTNYLKDAISLDFPQQACEESPWEREYKEHRSFAESRCRVYVGQQHYYDALNRYLHYSSSSAIPEHDNNVFYVFGESGTGKSSLIANWSQSLQTDERVSERICYTHLHFVGSSSSSADPTKMLHRLLFELRQRFIAPTNSLSDNHSLDSLPYDWEHLLLMLPEIFQQVSATLEQKNADRPEGSLPYVVVIILDALNQLTDLDEINDIKNDGKRRYKGKGNQSALSWLPSYLPPYFRLVVSSIMLPENIDIDIELPMQPPKLIQRRSRAKSFSGYVSHDHTLEVSALSAEGVKGIAVSYMSEYGKTLGENQIKMLMACEQTKNPLFLRSVLEEVRVWGKYELLTDQMASYLRKETIGELFDAILSRLEADFNTVEYPNLVQDSMRALWCSYAGLSEDELHNHLGCPRCIFSGLYLSIRENLTNRNGRLYFFHDYLKQTVEKKYLNDSENKITTHIKIATNFGESLLTDIMEPISTVSEEYKSRRKRCLLEVLWQLSYCQQYSLLNLLLSLPSVTQLLYEICKVNLFKLWRVSCPKGIKRLTAQNYIRECSWLLFQESTSYVEDDVVIINPFVDEHVDSLISANLKGLVDRIVVEERKIMSEWTLSARVTTVKLISNVLVQSAEFLEGSQLLSMALQSCESEEERIGIIAEQAKVCLILSQFSKGIELCEPIVKSMQQECIPSVNPKRHKVSSSYYDVMYALAKLYSSNGQYPAADPLFRKVLDHRISVDGENRPRTADVLSDIARHKFLQKYYVDALDLSQQVLAIRRVTTGERTPSFIAAIRDIGMLHHDLGEYDKAERYFTNALDVTEIVFGTDHPSVADVLNDLAVAMYMKNRKNSEKFGEIIATYERALSIRIASYGNMHKDVANTLNHMANVYRTKFDLGDTEAISRSISLYNRAREIKETNLHPMHPEVLLSRSNIANILLMTGMFSEAAVEHEAILGLRQKVHGIDNIQNATSMKNCGLAHMGLNNWQKSLQYHLDALRIRKAGLGDLHPKTVESNACVGDVYAAMGNSAKAIEHYKVAMDAWNEVQGDGNSDSARAMVIIKKLENGELVSEKLYCFL